MSAPYSQSAAGHPSTAPPTSSTHGQSVGPSSHTQTSGGQQSAGEALQCGAASVQQAGQQAMGAAREKLHEISQKAQETTQYAASQVREGIRHPSRATPYLIPILAVLLAAVAAIVPVSLIIGKSAKFSSNGYDESDYGHRARSMVHDKWESARDALLGRDEHSDHPVQSFSDRLWGRRTPSDELQYEGQRAVDEGEHRFSDMWHRAKDRMFGAKENADESAAASREFMLHSIDKLADKLHQLRNYYARGSREEKPSWIRNSWDSLMDGMHNLRHRLTAH